MSIISPNWFKRSLGAGAAAESTTVFLATFDGADTATSFTASIPGGAVTSSHAELDTAIKKFGTASGRFLDSGSGEWIWDNSSVSVLGVNTWTVEGFVYSPSGTIFNTTPSFYGFDGIGNSAITLNIDQDQNRILFSVTTDDGTSVASAVSATIAMSDDVWYHFALSHQPGAGGLELYFNGSRISQGNGDTDIMHFDFGYFLSNTNSISHIDSVRVSSSKLYTGASFTPPSSELT